MPFFANKKSTAGLVSLSNTRVVGLESGTSQAIHRPEVPSFWVLWRLARVRAKGGYRLRGVSRMGGAVWDQAVWIRAKCRAGDRGGARADKPRCMRILAITVGSRMAAMIVKESPLLKDTAPSLGADSDTSLYLAYQ